MERTTPATKPKKKSPCKGVMLAHFGVPRPPASPQAAARPPNAGGKWFLLLIPFSLDLTPSVPTPPPELGEAERGLAALAGFDAQRSSLFCNKLFSPKPCNFAANQRAVYSSPIIKQP